MKRSSVFRRAAAAVMALSVCSGAAIAKTPAASVSLIQAEAASTASRVRVDVNRNDGRSALYAPNAENWIYDGNAFTTSTGVTIKVSNGSGSGSVDCTNNKKLQKYDGTTPYYIADGLYNKDNDTSGALKIEISGLSNGTHSFSGWHACGFGNVTPSTLKISVNGSVKQTGIPCPTNITSDNDAGRSYVEFSGTSATILIQGEGNKSYSNAWLNAFEIDGASPITGISKESPVDKEKHLDISSGLSWTAGSGASSHDVYIGTDFNSVFNATKSSPEYKGNVTKAHFDLDDSYSSIPTYYWRVDEVGSNGTVKGNVYSFQVNRLAFPTAEGYGRYARGGRGGDVYHVTNLNDSGAGSLRYGLETVTGPRTIVFDVGGIIELKSKLTVPSTGGDVYIAGQTAPGDGITLTQWGFGMLGCDDVIVRDIRVRPGDRGLSGVNDVSDGMGLSSSNNCIIDHCSMSWSTDEGFSSRSASNITFQWNIIGEALHDSIHYNADDRTKTETHAFAASISGNIGSFHHNLLIDCTGRNWSLAGGMEQDAVTYGGYLDIRNNVVYNWRDRTTDGGVRRLNFVNNYYKAGASSNTSLHVVSIDGNELNTSDCQKMYVSGNVMTQTNGSYILKASDDAWSAGKAKSNLYNCTISDVKLSSPFCESYVSTDTAEEAYKRVIDNTSGAGANVPALDYIDSRYHKEVTNGTYTYTGSKQGLKGIIDSQKDCGGYPTSANFKSGTAAKDTDGDGIPDTWETAHGLNPNDKSDGAVVSLSGDDYTNLELYLNELAGDPVEFNGAPARSAFETIEAEEYSSESGTRIEEGSNETHVAYIENGDYICFRNIDFENGARSFTASLTGNTSQIELYLDSIGSSPYATIDFEGTGSWSSWTDVTANVPAITGKHTLYLVFKGGDGYLMNIDKFVFSKTASGRLINNVAFASAANAEDYALADNAQVGSPLFGDRAFTFTSLPASVTGAEQILTSCDDKGVTGDVITFSASEDITVYVALDSRMLTSADGDQTPAWLSGWTNTSEEAKTSNDLTFVLFSKDFSKGDNVTLGGNGYTASVVNYTVFVTEQKQAVTTTTTTTVTTVTTTVTTTEEPAPETTVTEPTATSEAVTTAAPEETATTTAETQPLLYGDANVDGKVSLADAVAILQFIGNKDKYNLTEQGKDNGDVFNRGDGITAKDALAIQQFNSKLVDSLPV